MSKQQGIELPAWHGNTLGSMSCLAPTQHMQFVHGGLPQRHPWGLQSSLQVRAGSVFLLLRAGSSIHSPNAEIITKFFSPLM